MIKVGNCIDLMSEMADCSVDSVVTDPPYELGFMGKSWDATGIAYNINVWQQCLRILKPGGHLLAFGGSRTYHRLACAIEDAGFQIRDQIMWVYGSGFPKSLNIGKQEGCKTWEGWGTALKPAHEPIVVAQKPLENDLTDKTNCLMVRFIYCSKASTSERNAGLKDLPKKKADLRSDIAAGMWKDKNAPHQNFHPTVKPVTLMRSLIKFVTPINGIVLDPFLGSGTTAVAAIHENIDWMGFEMNPEYATIAKRRVEHASF